MIKNPLLQCICCLSTIFILGSFLGLSIYYLVGNRENENISSEDTAIKSTTTATTEIKESTTISITTVVTQTTTTTTTTQTNQEFIHIPMSYDLIDFIVDASNFYNYDPELIFNMIFVESSFNPESTNGYYSGLMAVSEEYKYHYAAIEDEYSYLFNDGVDLYNPYQNIILGLRMLDDWRYMTDSSILDNLCYYNAGWEYENTNDTFYGDLVLNTNLRELDLSNIEIIY